METTNSDKSNVDSDLYVPQTDSFWEVFIIILKKNDKTENTFYDLIHHRSANIVEL